jgi:hypothetical protein
MRKEPGDYGFWCPACGNDKIWDRLFGICCSCGNGKPKKRTPMSETTKSTLRTIFAIASFIVQLVALHFIWTYHPR